MSNESLETLLLQYRLGARLGNSVWKAEDTRTGKTVVVKILARQLPRDAAKREALVRDVRLGAALYHTSIVNIVEVAVAGDMLLLVTDFVEGQPISAAVRGVPADRATFFRVAYQIGDALKLLHAKGVIHSNVGGDAVLLMANGQAKLAGFNLSTFLQKREGLPSAFQQRGGDARAVSYMAPEQITNQPTTAQTDIFSLGLVLFEMATGRPAYQGTTAAEIAHKIVGEQPPNPKSLNGNIDNAMLTLMGRCLFKDPFRRLKDGKAFVDDVMAADPEAAKFAMEIARLGVAPTAAQLASKPRNAILFLADIEGYERLEQLEPGTAQRGAARLQQILGEAVYLFDGEVIDPFGPRVVAELPSVESALEAARKAEFDVSPDQQEGEHVPIRMLLHAGDVMTKDGQVVGEPVTKGFEILDGAQPSRLLISEEFAKRARGSVRLHDAGARAGVKLYEIVAPEPKVETKTEINTEELEAQAAKEEEEQLAALAAAKKRRMTFVAIAAALVAVIAGTAVVFLKRRPAQTVVASAPKALPPATAATPRKIFLKLDDGDPAVATRAAAIHNATLEILRSFPELRIADAAGPDVTPLSETLRGADAAAAIQNAVTAVSAKLKLPARTLSPADALNAFADAVEANGTNDAAKTDASIRAAMKADPNFLAAHVMAMRFFDKQGKDADALDAAKHVASLDPSNADAARTIARAGIRSGDLGAGIAGYATVLHKLPGDVEALNMIGRYAYAVPDAAKFNVITGRVSSPFAAVHPPDLLLAGGRIDAAVGQFYEIERQSPNNAALALKIGRIAVLRHSTEIAEIELKKLQTSDPLYSYHLLNAYIAAAKGAKGEAASELKAANAASTAGDDFWTCSAEVAAISGDARGTLDALERAAARKEPTASYILSNPLFRFLGNEPRFGKVREALTAEQNEIRTALANIAL
ncbi:MAG TPA: protein kinase [Thermoanaerobaculia bacterium]|nr:protein kinase [Thermoanaerobaculia bacterium]